jgi:hypothetical protein
MDAVCFILDGYSKYLTYTKKGVPYYNRVFSVDEFNALIV